jgi:hypothetical protein
MARAPFQRVEGHLFGGVGPPGRGPAGLPAGRAWQAAGLRVARRGPV